MTKTAPKVSFMGKPMEFDDLPEPSASLESQFKPVKLSPRSIDQASQIVPNEYWQPTGIHTWLSGRANLAFSKLKVGETQIGLRGLKYFFEIVGDEPVLARVIRN